MKFILVFLRAQLYSFPVVYAVLFIMYSIVVLQFLQLHIRVLYQSSVESYILVTPPVKRVVCVSDFEISTFVYQLSK